MHVDTLYPDIKPTVTFYDRYKAMTEDEMCTELKAFAYWVRSLSKTEWDSIRSSDGGVYGFILESIKQEYKQPPTPIPI